MSEPASEAVPDTDDAVVCVGAALALPGMDSAGVPKLSPEDLRR